MNCECVMNLRCANTSVIYQLSIYLNEDIKKVLNLAPLCLKANQINALNQ